GKIQWMVPVRFDLVDPKQRLLIGEDAVARILTPNQLRAQASGYLLKNDEQSAALEALLAATPSVELDGTGDWTQTELQAIVADYFAMLDHELTGRFYSKTRHREALQEIVKRSATSIERKHQNISAVLQHLGLPWISGYKPLSNYQDALVDVIEV